LIAIVLPGGIVFCYLLLTGRWRLLKEMRLFTGTLLFLVVGAPWFILVSLRNPEFAHFFFIQEHVQRFLTKIHNRYEPFWFFIPVLLGTMLPWSLFIPATFRQLWLQRRQQGWSNRLYLFLWFAVIFIFFSKSNSKLVPYILPLFPALALLLGEGFANTLSAKSISFTMAAWLSVTLFALIGAAAICYPLLLPDPLVTPWEGLFVGVIFLGSATWIGMVIRRQETIHLLFTISLAAFLLSIIAPAIALPTIAARKTEKDLGLFIRDHVPKTTVVVSSGLKQGLSFYARRRIVVLRDPGEIEFGSKLGDQSSWFLSNEEFSKLWRSATPVVIQIKEDELPWLNQISPKQTAIIYDQEERVLVSNQH
jgi:4-amino-4-deoxy-L-arabinose transferase-like glycosyltransferase